MELTSAQVEGTLSQFEAEVIPDDHPALPQLNRLSRPHTFFLAANGLNILEPAGTSPSGIESAKVVNLANRSDGNPNIPELHEPKPTNVVLALGAQH
jgi:hypothetical protein